MRIGLLECLNLFLITVSSPELPAFSMSIANDGVSKKVYMF